jgi:cytochrome c oxidase subunit 3
MTNLQMSKIFYSDKSLNSQEIGRSQFQAQPFHLVTPSPWPLLTSFTLLILTSGTVIYFNGYANPFSSFGGGLTLVLIGFVTTASSITLWFRDVVTEGTFLGDHTFPVQKGITMGVGLFILSEVFFFISVF